MNIVSEALAQYSTTVKDDYTIMVASTNGVHAEVLQDLINISGFSASFISDHILNISLKTVQRYQKENKVLSARVSETVLKLIRLFSKGIEVFGTSDSFGTWLKKPAFGLGNQVPKKLLNTNTGVDLIEEELLRIEHGALA